MNPLDPRRAPRLLLALLLVLPTLPAAALSCTVTAVPSPVAIGNYTVLADLSATVDVTLSCTKTANGEKTVPWTLALSTGSTSGAGGYANRALFNGATALAYNIYTTAAFATIWGDATGGTGNFAGTFTFTTGAAGVGQVLSTTQTGHLRVVASQDLDAGLYATTTPITITAVASGNTYNATSFGVNSNLAANCLIDAAGDIAFGTYDPVAAGAVDVPATLTTRCTRSTNYAIAFSAGASGSFAPRRMDSAGANAGQLNYNLYTDNTFAAVWGDGSGGSVTVSGAGAGILPGAAVSRTFWGRLFAGQDQDADTYSDVITVTVAY